MRTMYDIIQEQLFTRTCMYDKKSVAYALYHLRLFLHVGRPIVFVFFEYI